MESQLRQHLQAVQRALRAANWWRGSAVIGGLTLAGALLLAASDQTVSAPLILSGAFLVAAALIWVALDSFRRFRQPSEVARLIEHRFPDLQQRLLTSVSFTSRSGIAPANSLSNLVLQQSLQHARKHDWTIIVPHRLRWQQPILAVLSLGIAAPILWNLAHRPASIQTTLGSTADQSGQSLGSDIGVDVTPGNIEVQRGTPLVIAAKFGGIVPAKATLIVRDATSGNSQSIPMAQRLQDPIFAHHLPQVTAPIEYHVRYGEQQSDTYQVTVFDYPELVQADATITYPEYTDLPKKQILDTRRVTAVQGSQLRWTVHLNKPVKEAWLEDDEGGRLALHGAADQSQSYYAEWPLAINKRWTLHLIDSSNRTNPHAEQLVARVTANQPPKIKPTRARDAQVSPLQELDVQASFWDDFGLKRYGVAFTLGNRANEEVELGQNQPGKQLVQLSHRFSFEQLDAQPDQLLSYHFWAVDTGPDGQPRKTYSDMYFAEVRPFEEIFREGAPQPGGQSPQQGSANANAQQAEQLLELQKQIVSATWNLIRKENGDTVSDSFQDEAQLVLDSQNSARDQADELAQRLTDSESEEHALAVRESMLAAVQALRLALEIEQSPPLTDALSAEQAAYQSLLNLRAREHEVARSQSSSSAGSGGGNQRLEQQLQQLELSNQDNRYETQRQAGLPQRDQQSSADDELREILSRLRDLARRQEDLNRQLQELQMALQRDLTEEQRKEIQRQLKRLRDQQEELLRDADQTAERTRTAQDQQAVRETQQKLEQSREQLRQSTEAAAQGDVNRALTAGTRAERQFQNMTDALREQTAEQFAEEMETMRDDARQLERQQQEIASQIEETANPQQAPGLRGNDRRPEIRQAVDQQRQRLETLQEQMKRVISEAERSEPLLAQKLYDSLRQANREQIDQRLATTNRLLENGLISQAQQTENQASQAVRQLRKGVEEAAEGILGNEIEGLRRAAGALDELARQLNRELDDHRSDDQAQPNEAGTRQTDATSQQESGRPSQTPPGAADRQRSNRQPSQAEASQEDPPQPPDGREQRQADQQARNPRQRAPQPGNQPQGRGRPGQQAQQGQSGQPGQQSSNQSSSQDSSARGGRSADNANRITQQSNQPAAGGGRPRRRQDGGGLIESFGENLGSGPITGNAFAPWSDLLRDVEEMLDDPELRSRAAQIRDRARNIRREMKRQSRTPQWSLVEEMVASPLEELRQRVELELARRSGRKDQLVPIDRDPVPKQFTDRVERYYERLGSDTQP